MNEVNANKAKEMPPLEEINRLLDYNPETGIFTWKVKRSSGANTGDVAGSLNGGGYLKIKIKGNTFYAHRLAKFITNGILDAGMKIDHVNGVRHDNRIVNLRCATSSINCQNLRSPMKTNKLGFLGVSRHGNKFKARIWPAKGNQIHLGTFNTPEEAHEAYLKAKRELHEGCTI